MSLADDLKAFKDQQIEANAGTREALGIIRNSQRSDRHRIENIEQLLRGNGRKGLADRVLIIEQQLTNIMSGETSAAQEIAKLLTQRENADKELKKERVKARYALITAVVVGLIGLITALVTSMAKGN